ncbi:MAG: tetratricopeptide repeat protein [Bacteroidia bacterium]|nr:tetratricopeptide repeat protein [Bacteroidia bacterium]
MRKKLVRSLFVILLLLCSAINTLKAQYRSGYDYYYAGLDMLNLHNYAATILMMDSAEAGGVDLFDLYNHRGMSYYNLGQYQLALDNYNAILKKTARYKSASVNAANAYYKLSNLIMAEKIAMDLIYQKVLDEYAYNIIGNINYSKKQYKLAIDNYSIAMQLDSQLSSPYYNCGITYYELKQYDSSIYYHQIARILTPDDTENLYGLALALSSVKRTDESLKICYEILSRDSLHYKSYAEIGYNLMQEPNYNPDIVSPFLQKAITMQPQNTGYAFNNLGDVYLRKGLYEQALISYNKAIQSNANNPEAYSGRGDVYRDSAKYENAIHDYMIALYLDPENSNASLALGGMMLRMNRSAESDNYYNRYKELTPNKEYASKMMNNARGYNELLTGQYEKALQSTSLALSIDPDYAFALNNKGMAFARLKFYDSAFYYLNRSVFIDPYNSFVYHNRAYVYAKTGNTDMACKDLKRLSEMNYPLRIDAALFVLNQKKCKYNFSNRTDTMLVKFDDVLIAVKRDIVIIEEGRKNNGFATSTKNLAASANVNFEKLDVIQLIAPNPATDEFTLQLKGRFGKPFMVNIVGMNGQSYRQYNFSELQKSSFNISCREWPVGTYVILLTAENKEIGRSRIAVIR